MAGDEHVIVLGADEEVATPPRRGRARSPLLMLIPVAALFAGLIGFVLTPQDESPTTVDPTDLPPPAEPLAPPPDDRSSSLSNEPALPNIAFGWRQVDLVGNAWQLSSIEAGFDGWLAVSQGPGGVIAHVSTDAVSWEAHTLTGLNGFSPVAVVGEGIMAVGVSTFPGADNRAAVAVSTDGGSSWTITELPGDDVAITSLAHVDGVLYGAGGDVDTILGASGGGDDQAGVWVFDGSVWSSLEVDPSESARFSRVVGGPDDTVWVLGSTNEGPAAWTVVGDEIQRMEVSLPEPFAAGAFLDVDASGPRYLALIGARGMSTSGRDLIVSDDLVEWRTAFEASSDLVSIEFPGDGSLVGNLALGGRLWALVNGSEVLLDEFFDSPGGESVTLPFLGAVAGADGVMVVGGSGDGGVSLLVRGVAATPVSAAATLADDRWITIDSIGVPAASPFDSPFATLSGDEETFLVVPGQVLAVTGLGLGEPTLEMSLLDPSWAGITPGGMVWASSTIPGATRLYIYDRGGVWSSEQVPLVTVASLGEVDGDLVAYGWDAADYKAVRLDESGGWVDHPLATDGIRGAVAVAGGLIATDDAGSALVSADGLSWEALENAVRFGFPGSVPFTVDENSREVTLLDGWPEVETFELPIADPWWIVRSGADLWVSNPFALAVGNSADGWEQLPLDLEHGIEGTVLPVPGGDAPIVAVVRDGEVLLAQWVEGAGPLRRR